MAQVCPKDQADLIPGPSEGTVVCSSCRTHYYSMGTLIEDRGQGASHTTDWTKTSLPESVIKIKPSDRRK